MQEDLQERAVCIKGRRRNYQTRNLTILLGKAGDQFTKDGADFDFDVCYINDSSHENHKISNSRDFGSCGHLVLKCKTQNKNK